METGATRFIAVYRTIQENSPFSAQERLFRGHIGTLFLPLLQVESLQDARDRGIQTYGGLIGKSKKRQRETTGLTPDGKKQAHNNANLLPLNPERIDLHNENDVTWRMALDTVVPVGTKVPRGAGMKECCICNQHLVSGQTDSGLIIARCT